MNRRRLLIITAVGIISVATGIILVIGHVGWSVEENVATWDWNLGSATEHPDTLMAGVGSVKKGDKISFHVSVVAGDPIDLYVLIAAANGTHVEIIRWDDITGYDFGGTWTVSEEGSYWWAFESSGDYSHVQGGFSKAYIKHFP